jgi:hypothetical protein
MRHGVFQPLALALLLALAAACSKDPQTPATTDLGHAYFPTDTGRWIQYAVDSIWRNDLTGQHDSVDHPLLETVTEHFIDPQGRPAQRLLRQLQDSAGNWYPKDVWWQVRTNTQAERAEENMRRIKLVFPPRIGQYWNTNATNTDPSYELTYQEVDVPWQVNGLQFDSTVLVKTTYFNNAVVTNTYYERYAKHVGLVYRQVDSTDTQLTGVRGTWYRQTVTAYGP